MSCICGAHIIYYSTSLKVTEHFSEIVPPFRSIAKELADWLIHNNVVEHIFGPNLHIEVRILNSLQHVYNDVSLGLTRVSSM